jgi:hypothetical protein
MRAERVVPEQDVLAPGPGLFRSAWLMLGALAAGGLLWLATLIAGTFFVRGCVAVIDWAWTVGR